MLLTLVFFFRLSYVIQNFHKCNTIIVPNHRYNLVLNYNNTLIILTMFKFFLLYIKLPKILEFNLVPYEPSFGGLFMQRIKFLEPFFELNGRLHLITKFHRTLFVLALNKLFSLLTLKHSEIVKLTPGPCLTTCTYFFPLRVVFFTLHKKFYKPFFLFILFLTPFMWPVIESYYVYSNSNFIPNPMFKLVYFENFKIFRTQQL